MFIQNKEATEGQREAVTENCNCHLYKSIIVPHSLSDFSFFNGCSVVLYSFTGVNETPWNLAYHLFTVFFIEKKEIEPILRG